MFAGPHCYIINTSSGGLHQQWQQRAFRLLCGTEGIALLLFFFSIVRCMYCKRLLSQLIFVVEIWPLLCIEVPLDSFLGYLLIIFYLHEVVKRMKITFKAFKYSLADSSLSKTNRGRERESKLTYLGLAKAYYFIFPHSFSSTFFFQGRDPFPIILRLWYCILRGT